MADIKVSNTCLEGVYVIEPIVFSDVRGTLFEAYNGEMLNSYGMKSDFVQDNEVTSHKDVLRGMHVNINNPQTKLIRVLDGEILDVLIDLRKESKTYMQCFSIILSQKNRKQLYIPERIGHGYLALESSRVLFKTSTHFTSEDEIGFAWNSKEIEIDWKISNPIQNERDRKYKMLSEVWK